jgi:hypothetical protein
VQEPSQCCCRSRGGDLVAHNESPNACCRRTPALQRGWLTTTVPA